MIDAAREGNATLAVGFVRRFRWAYRFAKQIIESKILGSLRSVDVSEGGIFDWPVASPFFLDRQAAGGGVLADASVHAIDALQWWLGDLEVTRYCDDDMGGVEADCVLDFKCGEGVTGHIELSRTRAMRNTTILRGSNGSLEIQAFTNEISLRLNDCAAESLVHCDSETSAHRMLSLRGGVSLEGPSSEAIFADQLRDFLEAVQMKRSPMVDGLQGRRSVEFVERCYASRKPLEHPWVFEGTSMSAGGTR